MKYIEVTITLNPVDPYRDLLVDALGNEGPYDSFVETPDGLKAYVPADQFDAVWLQEQIDALHQFSPLNSQFSIQEMPDKNWNEEWEKQHQPVMVVADNGKKIWVRAPFHEHRSDVDYEIEIEPNTFTVPEPDTSYAVVITTVVIGLLCVAIIIVSFIKNKKINEKIGRYKNMIVAPQYQPNPNYQLMEITEVYLGDKKDAKVGALLKMIVDKKVSLRKKEESGLFKNKWELIINNRAELSEEESLLLQLLSGGSEIVNGESFDLKSHIADTGLVLIGKSLDKKVLDTIKEEGLVSRKYKIGSAGTLSLKSNIISNLTLTFCVVLIAWPMTMFVLGIVSDMMLNFGKITLYDSECNLVLIPIIAIMMFILL